MLGKVIDIIFAEGKNPNNGDLPMYIIVDFRHYKGKPIFKDHPTYVPIPRVDFQCEKSCFHQCCKRTRIPLQLAFGKTIHTFQGNNVGQVNQGQQENHIKKIVVDPGDRKFEGLNIGTFYSIQGRITTMGDPNNKKTSAIFFTGQNFKTIDRVMNIRQKLGKNEDYEMVTKRDKWVDYLKSNTHDKSSLNATLIDKLFPWATNTRYNFEQLNQFLHRKYFISTNVQPNI